MKVTRRRATRVSSVRPAAESCLGWSDLKFVLALSYDVVRRHEPEMYIEPPSRSTQGESVLVA
jgi:hypothetical protein